VFDTTTHAEHQDRMRRQATETNLCPYAKTDAKGVVTEEGPACGKTAGKDGKEVNSKCCKVCEINNVRYTLDVNTFKETMSRGTRKNPMMEYDYCGLAQRRSWPSDKDQTVGVLNTPFTEDKCGPLPNREPDTKKYTRTDLPLSEYSYSGDAEVLFVKHSYKWMHPSSEKALKALATEFNELAGKAGLKLLVTQGFVPLPSDRPAKDVHKDLYYEARELHITIVYTDDAEGRSKCGSKCLMARLDEEDASSPFHEYAVRYKKTDEVPPCLKDGASKADLLRCVTENSLQNQEYNYRLLADFAFEHFDYVEHVVLAGTEFLTPVDSVVMSMRDHHRACGATADIAFLLDGSGSVGPDGWKDQLKFVKSFTGAVRPSEDGAHIAVATFAGPRYSHFADHFEHVVEIVEEKQCTTDDDCEHDVMETEGQFGAREVCKVVAGTSTKKCHTLVPQHCPLGTLYEMGTKSFKGDVLSYGCICAQGESCAGEKYTDAKPIGCREGFFELNEGDCGAIDPEDRKGGAMLDVKQHDAAEHPECQAGREFFTHTCEGCSCSMPDYEWDESHSSWTNFDFKDHKTAEEIFATLDKGTPTDDNLLCPVIGHGEAHNVKHYEEFHARDDFCWANGATHLAMGLKHVLVGNGNANDNGGGGDRGMFDPRNGARASHKFPRILIVLTDGKSNPHFEPDQWIEEIRNAGIEVFAVGMGDRDANDLSDVARRDYKKELNMMASEPLDYHRFDVQGASHLNDILLHLTDGLCEKPVFLPPGGFEIDPQLDEGQSQNYQINCEHMTETVYVMVDTLKGHSRVFVSADVREPSEFNKGANGVEDISADRHKIMTFEGGSSLADNQNLYIGVTNGDATTAEFRIQVLLDVFQDSGMEMKGAEVDGKKAGDVIYAPKLKAGKSEYGSLGDWEISVASSDSSSLNNKGFFEYKQGKGIVVTAKGAAEFASVPFVTGTLELTAANKKLGTANTAEPGCMNGFFHMTFTHKFKTYVAKWDKDEYIVPNLLEYAEFDTLRAGVRQRRADIPAEDGVTVVSVACADCIRYEVESGNEGGTFALAEDGTLTVADKNGLDAETSAGGSFDIAVVAFNAENQKSENPVHIKITVKNVDERPYLKIEGGTFSVTEALEKGLDANSEYNDPAVAAAVGDAVHDIEIMNPGRLGRDKLECSRKDSVSDLNVEFHVTDRCLSDGAQGCVCRIKRGSGLNTEAGTSATLELRVSAVAPGGSLVVQDTQTVTLSWEEGTTIPEPENPDGGNGAGDACADDADDKPVKLGLTKIKCSEASALGYCLKDRTAAVNMGNAKAEDLDDDDWASQWDNFQSRCPVACAAPCTIKFPTDGPCHLQDPSKACGGAAKGTCVDVTIGALGTPAVGDTPAVGAPGGISLGAASKCECVFPNVGDNCESEQDPANDPCAKKAEGSESGAACFNDGVCHPAKSEGSNVWDTAVCICALKDLQCWGGLSCELKVDELCPAGTNSCLVRKKAVKGVCSEDPPCVPAFDSEPSFCLPPSLAADAKIFSEAEVADMEAELAAAKGEDTSLVAEEKGGKWWIALIVIFVLLVIFVALFLLYKRKQTNDTIAALQSSRSQTRSGTTTRGAAAGSTTNRGAAAGGRPARTQAPVQGNSNPMYGMGGMPGGDDATYGDVPNGAAASSGYADVPVSIGHNVASVDNPMYGMGAGGDGVYDAATAPAVGTKGYMDIAPNAALQGAAYMDVAPNNAQQESAMYTDVAPTVSAGRAQARGGVAKPVGNPSYQPAAMMNDDGTYGAPLYDQAQVTNGGGAPLYDQAQVTGGGNTDYEIAAQRGGNTMYDTAA
jgi:hypothetical protein